VKGTIAEALET